MKTAREILFERHRGAEPKLHAIRQSALAALPAASTRKTQSAAGEAQTTVAAMLGKLWLELIWSSRRAWSAIAALWVVVLAVNLQMSATAPARPAAQPGADMARALAEQQRVLAELLPPMNPPQADVTRPKPGPRSDRVGPFKKC